MNLKLHNTLQTLPGAISNVHLVVDVVPENVVHAWKLPATGHKQVFLRQLHSTSAFKKQFNITTDILHMWVRASICQRKL